MLVCTGFALALALALCAGRGVSADDSRSEPLAECLVRGGIPNVLEKLESGRAVRIIYLGGSITKAPGWRTMTEQWFREQYPQARIEATNAAISGTGSDLAAFRLQHDVLRHEPDLLFVEFAVNDSWTSAGRIQRAMEGVVRQTWRAQPNCDIIFVYTVHEGMLADLQAGEPPPAVKSHEIVANHYDIASVLFGVEVARLEKEGKLIFTGDWPQTEEEKAALGDTILFSGDGAHPYDAGHALYAAAVIRSIGRMKGVGEPGPQPLPAPLREDNFEYAKPTPLDRAQLSPGWRKLDVTGDPAVRKLLEGAEFGDKLDALWLAEQPGESISFRFRGTSVMVYDMVGPDCGQIIVTVDGGEPRTIPRFDSWCEWHRVYCFTAAADLPDEVHTIRFEIDHEQPDKVKLLAERGITMDDPARYDATRWYVGYLLIAGHIVE